MRKLTPIRLSIFIYMLLQVFLNASDIPTVDALTIGDTVYHAPNSEAAPGVIEARDKASGELKWELEVYKVPILPFLKEEWQLHYITAIEESDGQLEIATDNDSLYLLNPETQEVTGVRVQLLLHAYILIIFFVAMFLLILYFKRKSIRLTQAVMRGNKNSREASRDS